MNERRAAWLAFAGYSAVTLALAGPLLFRLNSHIIGPHLGDNQWCVWSLWLFRDAVEHGRDPAYTNQIYGLLSWIQIFPDAYVDLLLAWPLQHAMGPIAVYNLLVLASFPLSGITTYFLVAEVGSKPLARFAAGFFFAFSTYHFARSAGHLGLLTIQWLPLFAWRMLVFFRSPSVTNAIIAGFALALVPLSDVYYAAYFALPFAIVLVPYQIAVDAAWFRNPRRLLLLALVVVIGVGTALGPLWSYLHVTPDIQEAIASYRSGTESLSSDLASLFLPASANPIFGSSVAAIYQHMTSEWPVETFVFLGHPALLLAVASLIRDGDRRICWLWGSIASLALVLTLGPKLHVAGRAIASLPFYSLLFRWPMLDSFRAPNRLSVLALLAVCVLAARGLGLLFTRVRPRVAAVATIVLLAASLAESTLWSFTIPTIPVRASILFRWIATDPDPRLLLDLPIAPSGEYLLQQVTHRKRLVGGYAPRQSSRMASSVASVPFLSELTDARINSFARPGRDLSSFEQSFRNELERRNIGFVVLHPPVENRQQVHQALKRALGEPFYDSTDEQLTAWRIPAPGSR